MEEEEYYPLHLMEPITSIKTENMDDIENTKGNNSSSQTLNSDIKMETEDFVEEDQNSAGLNNEWKINKVPIKSELDKENPNGNFNFDDFQMKQAAFLHHSLFPDGAGSRLFPSGSEKRSSAQDFANGNLENQFHENFRENDFTEKTPVKKRIWLTLDKKLEIIQSHEAGASYSKIARERGMNESSVRTIVKKKHLIKERSLNTSSYMSKVVSRPRSYAMENMEKLLLVWVEDCNQKKISLSQKSIRSKAKGVYDRVKAAQKANGNLSKEVEINELFHASSGWFERFRHRTGFDYSNNPHDDSNGDLTGDDLNGTVDHKPNVDLNDDTLMELFETQRIYEEQKRKEDEEERKKFEEEKMKKLQESSDALGHNNSNFPSGFQETKLLKHKIPSNADDDTNASSPILKLKQRKWLTLEEKLDIIQHYEDGLTITQIANAKNMPMSSVRAILNKNQKIKEKGAQLVQSSSNGLIMPKATKTRSYAMENMERLLLIWIEDRKQKGMPITLKLIKAKAKSLHFKIKEKQKIKSPKEFEETFAASSGWFDRFKHRARLDQLVPTFGINESKQTAENGNTDSSDSVSNNHNSLDQASFNSVQTNDLDDDSLMDFLEDPSVYEENQNDYFITKNELSANELSTIILKVQDLCEFLQKTDTSNRDRSFKVQQMLQNSIRCYKEKFEEKMMKNGIPNNISAFDQPLSLPSPSTGTAPSLQASNRIRLSLSQKAKLIYESSKPGFDQEITAKTFGISVPYLSKILKNQSARLNSLNNVMSKNNKSLLQNDDTSEENYPLHLMEPITSIKTEEYMNPVDYEEEPISRKNISEENKNNLKYVNDKIIVKTEFEESSCEYQPEVRQLTSCQTGSEFDTSGLEWGDPGGESGCSNNEWMEDDNFSKNSRNLAKECQNSLENVSK